MCLRIPNTQSPVHLSDTFPMCVLGCYYRVEAQLCTRERTSHLRDVPVLSEMPKVPSG